MRPTLLLADDSVTIQRVIELTFAHEDLRVITVSDGRQAIDRINLERPDVVLADVGTPGSDGYAISAHVKNMPGMHDVPVLLLAGAFEPVDEARVRESGCDGVLVKPFGPQQLVARVKDLLAARDEARRRAAEAPPTPVGVASAFGAAMKHEVPPAPLEKATMSGPGVIRLDVDLDLEPLDAGLDHGRAGLSEPAMPHAGGSRDYDDAEPLVLEAEALEPPTEPVWDLTPAHPLAHAQQSAGESSNMAALSRVSLSNAFSALLAAEQSQTTQAIAPVVSEAVVEDVVRRVLERLTGDMVRNVVLEAAERLVKQEIDRLKTDSD